MYIQIVSSSYNINKKNIRVIIFTQIKISTLKYHHVYTFILAAALRLVLKQEWVERVALMQTALAASMMGHTWWRRSCVHVHTYNYIKLIYYI